MKKRVLISRIVLLFALTSSLFVFNHANFLHGQNISQAGSNSPRCVLIMMEPSEIRSTYAILKAKLVATSPDVISYYFVYQNADGITKEVPAQLVPQSNILTAKITLLNPRSDYSCFAGCRTTTGKITSNVVIFTTLPKETTITASVTHHKTNLGNMAGNILSPSTWTGRKHKIVNACNYKNTTVRNKAVSIAGQSPGNFNIGQICNIFDYCYNNWHYVNDPSKGELYSSASNTLANGLNGDCDDFAILVCSMLLSIGGDARISLAYNSGGGHAFTEINVGKTNMQLLADYIAARYKDVWTEKIHYRIDRYKNCWLNLDWWAKHPGGQYYKADHGSRIFILDNYSEDF